nr:SpaA isopeptide-forming pilin-related protein [uncultured Anaerococcus sp.]
MYNMTLGKGQSISEFTFNGLAKGSYILEEVEAPKGYKKIAPMELQFDVAKGTALVNQSDPYGASSKIHENPVNGAYEIEIYNDSGSKPKKGKVKFIKTNQYGRRFTDDMYTVLKEKIENGEFGNVYGEDKYKKIYMLINEFTKSTDFVLYRDYPDGFGNYGSFTTKDGVKIYPAFVNGSDLQTFMNGKTGEFEFDGLGKGKYWIVEQIRTNNFTHFDDYKLVYDVGGFSKIEGGVIAKELASSEVNRSGYVYKVNDKKINDEIINVSNTKKSTSFNIKKVDSNDRTLPLEGAEFTLFWLGKDNKTKQVDRQTSDSNGLIHFEDIRPGTYRLYETKAPEGYHLSRSPFELVVDDKLTVTVRRNGQRINKTAGFYTFTNNKETMIRIIKNNENNKPLKGVAKFCIFKVGDDVSDEDINEALANNDGWSLAKNKTNCSWHEYTDDKGDDLIRLKGKDYYLPKKANTGINYQILEVKDCKLESQALKFRISGKYIFAEYESPYGYDIIKKTPSSGA